MWGLYVGVFLVIEGFLRGPYRAFCEKHGIDNAKAGIHLLRQCLVFLFFIPAGLFFRARSLAEIGEIFVRIFTAFGSGGIGGALEMLSMDVLDILVLAGSLACLLLIAKMGDCEDAPRPAPLAGPPLTGQALLSERSVYAGRAAAQLYCVLAIALGWFILLSSDTVSAFVYFQF